MKKVTLKKITIANGKIHIEKKNNLTQEEAETLWSIEFNKIKDHSIESVFISQRK